MNWLRTLTRRMNAAIEVFEPYYRVIAVAITLVLSIGVVLTAWRLVQDTVEAEARLRFEFRAREFADAVRGRMVDYEQALRGGAGLFAASVSVERGEWREFVRRLRVEQIYPGIQGLGFARYITPATKDRFERAVRAEGYPEYAIRPPGERAEYTPIHYLEPLEGRNLRAFGYDMFSEPVRRSAMERARDTGETAISGRVTLVQETDTDIQAGFLMYVPIYRKGADARTVDARREALVGYVYSPFRASDLARGILGEQPRFRIRIYDGDVGGDALLYDSANSPAARAHAPVFASTVKLPMRGRVWSLSTESLPQFEETIDRERPLFAALIASVISALVLVIIWSLASMRAGALRLARTMTRELRESRERLALALEGSNEALFDWDVETGRVVLSEQWSRILGGGVGRVDTHVDALLALVHPDDRERVLEKSADLVNGRMLFYNVEHRVRDASGAWRWISSRAKVVDRDASGRSLRVAGTNTDITNRKEIERIKSEFIATVSHELRTPLTAIIGALGLLKEETAGKLEPDAAHLLEMADQNSERLRLLVNDILDLERIESGRLEIRADALSAAPVLERAATLNATYAEKHGVRFELLRPLPDAVFTGDEDRVLQVMANLLSNAAKFSPHGEVVTIGATVGDGKLRVSVSDRGVGISQEFRGRIFEKFSQADSSDSRRKGGTGLGLSICKALVEHMGGSIGFESEPGKGTTFYFELPLANR